jgi:hypothetical protein
MKSLQNEGDAPGQESAPLDNKLQAEDIESSVPCPVGPPRRSGGRILHSVAEWTQRENDERKAQDLAARARRKVNVAAPAVPEPPAASDKNTSRDVLSEQATVERLQAVLAEIDAMPMPIGEPACLLLDALEITDRLRTTIRERAREMLVKEPDSIPGWTVTQCAPIRELSKSDTLAIFKLLVEADNAVTGKKFISSASISIGAIEALLAATNPDLTPKEVTAAVNDILADRIHYRPGVARLTRHKDQLELPFKPAVQEEEEG